MSDEIVATLIASSFAVLGSFAGNYAISLKKSREQSINDAEREQSEKDQLDMILEEQKNIRARLDSHNGYAEKFAENSKNLAVLAEKQESTNKAIDRMQKDIDYLKSDRCKV